MSAVTQTHPEEGGDGGGLVPESRLRGRGHRLEELAGEPALGAHVVLVEPRDERAVLHAAVLPVLGFV